jgi:hypothetical protein
MGRPSEDTLGPVNEDLDGPLPVLDAQYIAALFPNKRDSVSKKKRDHKQTQSDLVQQAHAIAIQALQANKSSQCQ